MSSTVKSTSKLLENLTCKETFEAVRVSNEKVITEIYRQYLPIIKSYIYKRGGNKEDAHDIFQQSLMIIFKNVQSPEFKFRKSFGAYVVTVARNLWSKQLRKSSRIDKDTSNVLLENKPCESMSIDSRIEEDEKKRLFNKVLRTLPEDAQKIMNLYFEGKKMREIAKIMGYASESYAKKRKCIYQKKLIHLIKSNPAYGELAL